MLIEIRCYHLGMTNTWETCVWVSPDGCPVPVRIQTHGVGKYHTGDAVVDSCDFPVLWKVSVRSGEIDLTFFDVNTCPQGQVVRTELAPPEIQTAAEKIAGLHCYHCGCFSSHLKDFRLAVKGAGR